VLKKFETYYSSQLQKEEEEEELKGRVCFIQQIFCKYMKALAS